jgi:hypothetical protein
MNLSQEIKKTGMSLAQTAAECEVSLATLNLWRLRSDGKAGRLPNSEQGKRIERAFGADDFRKFFPTDWPFLKG